MPLASRGRRIIPPHSLRAIATALQPAVVTESRGAHESQSETAANMEPLLLAVAVAVGRVALEELDRKVLGGLRIPCKVVSAINVLALHPRLSVGYLDSHQRCLESSKSTVKIFKKTNKHYT